MKSLIVSVVLVPIMLVAGPCSLVPHVEEPALVVEKPFKAPPGPEDTTLHLGATGVFVCGEHDQEIVDVTISETQTEIVIEAGLRINRRFQLHCETRTTYEGFVVQLERPLGDRRVIDDSRGERSVIWSPQKRKDVLKRRAVKVTSAERFLRLKFPGGGDVNCVRDGPIYFSCTLRALSRPKPMEFYVEVRRGAKLKALAANYAAFRAQKELMHPRGR